MTSNFLRKLPIVVTCGLIVWVAAKYILPVAMPFLLAILLAVAAEPLVRGFERRLKLNRQAATGLGVASALTLLVLLVLLLSSVMLRQVQNLVGVVPDLEGTAMAGMDQLQLWMLSMTEKAPEAVAPILKRGVNGLFTDGTALLDKGMAWLLSLASGFVSRLPDSALGIGTWLVASFMFSAKLPAIRRWLDGKLSGQWRQQYLPALKRVKGSVIGWLSAQLKLISITFLVLLGGFWLLRFEHALVWAFLISLVDALPILGTGVVLVPWSAVCFIRGDTVAGAGLLGVYATAVLLRSILEPKLVGKHLGLDSLVTLMAIYAGYRLWGIPGLLLAPLLTVTVVQLFSAPKDGI